MYEEIVEKYPNVFLDIAENFGCKSQDVVILKPFSEGRSGDLVLLICVKQASDVSNCGDYVLKIFSNDVIPAEIAHTFQVDQHTQGDHILIPKLRYFSVNPSFYLYDVAGDEFLQAIAFSKLESYAITNRLEKLSTYLLSEWNRNYQVQTSTLYTLIRDWVGEARLANGSRLSERIRNQITDELTDSFRFEGDCYPNPLYYLISQDSPLMKDNAKLECAIYGQVHGDLNMNNVIVQMIPGNQGYQFYLIDFEQYRPKAPLLFDHAYLMLCILLEDAKSWTLIEWCEEVNRFFSFLTDQATLPCNNRPPYSYMKAQSDAITWFSSHQQPHNRPTIKRQMLAAHVAAGINFINKRNSDDRQQKLALLYASIAMRSLLNTLGDVPSERSDLPELQIGQTENPQLWRIVEHFSPENRYILLTSGEASSVSADQLINLSPIGWMMILEINHMSDNPIRDQVLPVYKRVQGYRVYDLPVEANRNCESAPAWVHLSLPEEKPNLTLYYNRQIQDRFRQIVKAILSLRENEPLFIIADFTTITADIRNAIVNDILIQAGEKTPVHLISLSGISTGLESDEIIQCFSVENNLAELANIVYQLREHDYDPSEVRIPGKDGFIRLSPETVANLSNDMVIIHRNIIYNAKDDNGEGFFRGNEANWLDIANGRDVLRLDYVEKWKSLLESKISQVSTGAGTIINLYHRAGGGGTTLAMRIAWDFCINYPTVMLRTYSNQTAERLKTLYSKAIKPIFVIVEVSDGKITLEGISSLRRELIHKDIRVLFLVVSRFVGKEHRDYNKNNLYLSDTPDLSMADQEAQDMLKQFSNRLNKTVEGMELSQDIESRIRELNTLTYSAENTELRQPFFYGLYAYGKGFQGIPKYVEHHCVGISKTEQNALNILAMITLFSQSVNLSFEETALFLFPNAEEPAVATENVKSWLYCRDLIVRRERGIRICHPLIAQEILQRNKIIQKSKRDDHELEGTEDLVDLACQFVDCMVAHYTPDSQRVNSVFRDIFTHREVVYEDEQMKFSPLLTMLYSRERCVRLMHYIVEAIPQNPHFRNHLARLYLYPVTQDQKSIYPDPDTALIHAKKAVELAEDNKQEGISIHYHVLGKVYMKQCITTLYTPKASRNLSSALKAINTSYQNACNAFDCCIARDNSGYGLTGKLELITNVLSTIKRRLHGSISEILTRNAGNSSEISTMLSEASDLISQYLNRFDTSSTAFRIACIKFFNATGNLERLELIFNASALTSKEKSINNRAISAVLMGKGVTQDKVFSYDNISQDTLKRIFDLMNWNINAMEDNEQDRIRWFEAYRRLPESTLEHAYRFLMEWPRAENNLFVCYYRYIIAFLLCETTGKVDSREVKKHLIQSEMLSRNTYGKNVTASLNYYGIGEPFCELLMPWLKLDPESSKEKRKEQNVEYRSKYCKVLKGRIEEINNGMITIRFHCGDGTVDFFAKSPNIYPIELEDEGKQVKFSLGFSYSGMRAWDVVLDNSSESLVQ